jgi:cytochrome c oxidase subunit 1
MEWSAPSPAPHGNWPGELPEAHRGPYEYGGEGEKDHTPQWSTP